ncbi:hypothetical protein OC844_008069, partial [Tilletia horrida]
TFAKRLSSGRMSHGRFSSMSSLKAAAQAQAEADAGKKQPDPALWLRIRAKSSRQSVVQYQRRANPNAEDEDDDEVLAEARAQAMSPQGGPGGSGPQSMDTLHPGDMYDQDRYAPRPSSRSSFFGMDPPSNGGSTGPSTTQAEQIAAYH